MQDFDARETLDVVCDVLKTAPSAGEGVGRLLRYWQSNEPQSALREELRQIDFAADAAGLGAALEEALRVAPPPADYTGFYFGLDGLNMPDGKGVEFGCGRGFAEGSPDIEWVYRCDRYFDDLPSPALAHLYGAGAQSDDLPDYLVCLGYLGLALRDAFRNIDPPVVLNGARARAVVWGFHNGDLGLLGVARPHGFDVIATF